jgi:hypothetical protein
MLAPTLHFATLAAVQKKNSLCEPNFKTAQPYDLTGAQHEIGEISGYQVAQHDGITNRTLRASAPSRETLFPCRLHAPEIPRSRPDSISRHSSRSRKKIRYANPISKPRNHMI